MATLRELKGRIGSVSSTEKITGAMKMISSAKMRKAEQALRRLVPFRRGIQGIIANLLTSDAEFTSPLTEVRETRRVALLVFGSDDGLCGAYNTNLSKYACARVDELRASRGEALPVEVYAVGTKMLKALVSRLKDDSRSAVALAAGVDSKSDGPAVKALLESLMQRFVAGELDTVELLYMHYHSAGRQRPSTVQMLPVDPAALAAESGEAPARAGRPYLYEPDAAAIFSSLLPMHLLAVLQDAFAENRASEQAARVMAMQAASDNARKLLEQLQLEYNKLRQQGITTELLDIVGGQARD
ncbi:MAG: ATP synthase F1 subunit gamma [Muribaculaceae bacterium]|nr:ATP synthase F1 subunit gamma [Muribaculaceae bacterium]MDE6286983.1 ATP synthase F1 subunit gamma [Muribaculaceae bacterium]